MISLRLCIATTVAFGLGACANRIQRTPAEATCQRSDALGVFGPSTADCNAWRAAAERDAQAEAIRKVEADRRQREQNAAQEEETRKQRAAQVRAETAADNICAMPSMARQLMIDFNSLQNFRVLGMQAVDLEHVTTPRQPDPGGLNGLVCRATFVVNNGTSWRGTLAYSTNIVGDWVFRWRAEGYSQ